MKICITSHGNTLESQVDPRFGRCAFFIVVDTDTMEFEAIENNQAQAMGGAGVQSGKIVSEKGVEVLLTGNVGPNAYQTLQASGVNIITGISGLVQEAIEKYKNRESKPINEPSVESHFGMKEGINMPQGDGTGPSGQGPGTGKGMGGKGQSRGRGLMGGNRPGAGSGGNCVCPACGTKVPHQQGMPCYRMKCPDCGQNMARE
jgi:predicted Fe-Mo cluster-binding NifX family protein